MYPYRNSKFTGNYPRRRIPVRRPNGYDEPAAAPVHEQAPAIPEPTPARNSHNDASPPAAPDRAPATSPDASWQAQAQRLQADMDNFRKRQRRRADEAISAERERLLSLLLPVADNLQRALSQQDQQDASLRQGVELTHRELMRTLAAEGVVRLEAMGQPFDPTLHEAVAVIPADSVESDLIVEEIEPGYTLGDKLLRPAKVIVAA